MKKPLLAAVFAMPFFALASEYQLDPLHTNAIFEIDHFATSTNIGIFNNLEGKLLFDAQKQTGQIDLSIPLEKLDTGRAQFDNHLKSGNLFHASKYPNIRFKSSRWNFSNNKVTSIDGQLTIKGITKPITLVASKFNCYDSPMFKKQVCGGDFTATIDRTQWGVDYLVNMGMTKNVKITIHAEAVKQ